MLDIEDDELWSELISNSSAVDYNSKNIAEYFSVKCEAAFDDTLIQYINAKGEVVLFEDCFESDDTREKFFTAIVKSIRLNNEIYKGFLEQFNLRYSSFSISNLPLDKFAILDRLGIVVMNIESLMFIREHYAGYLNAFIKEHIAEYIAIVSETDEYLRDEMLEMLNMDISDNEKISLLELEKESISISGEMFSDAVTSHILLNNFDADDFSYLVESYSRFGTHSKPVILEKATREIRTTLAFNTLDRQLLSALIISANVNTQNKRELFKSYASKATDSEIKEWLPFVESDDFLALYDDSKRPRFENNEWNKALLDIFKKRKFIKDYEFSEHLGKFTVTRWRKGKSGSE